MPIRDMDANTSVALPAADHELSNLRGRIEMLSSLIEVSIIINSTLDLDELITLVLEKAQSVMRAEASSVLLINEQTGLLEVQAALGEVGQEVKNKITLRVGEGIAGWVAQTGEAVIVPDAQNDPRFAKKADEDTGFHTRSILAVPLKVQEKIIGVAEVINPLGDRSFTDDDLHLFSTFSRQVALAIENARMHTLMLERQKFEQQLEAARIIQESFMPQSFPVSPMQRFEVAAKSIPATSIGGDFYDFIEFDDDTLGLVMGDVAGKGIPAALYMARLVSDFRFHTQINRDPADTLTTINNLLVERGRRGMFVTLQYAVLDIPTGQIQMACAGHLPALRIFEDGARCELVPVTSGAPLGIIPDMRFELRTLELSHGDFLVYFTDGIIEAKNKGGKHFSLERLIRFLRQSWQSPEEIVEALIRHVNKFSSGTAQHDDLTVVALKWC